MFNILAVHRLPQLLCPYLFVSWKELRKSLLWWPSTASVCLSQTGLLAFPDRPLCQDRWGRARSLLTWGMADKTEKKEGRGTDQDRNLTIWGKSAVNGMNGCYIKNRNTDWNCNPVFPIQLYRPVVVRGYMFFFFFLLFPHFFVLFFGSSAV